MDNSRGSLQYVLVDDPATILPQTRKLKLHEISKSGMPMYQLEKGGKHKRSKDGDVYYAVQKIKLSKGIVSKLSQAQLKQLNE